MFTKKSLAEYISSFISDLRKAGCHPDKVVLFGSYAYGSPNHESDIDLAIWSKTFVGVGFVDIEPFVKVISKYPGVEVHTFGPDDDAETNPFVEEILKRGQVVG